ncbi:MAG: 3-oxoacyl-ACP synthase III [Planctomycetota bacterium]
MRFEHVRIAAFGYALPETRVTSLELEERLESVYERFRLRAGRLELMSGIRERRFWPAGTRPSEAATLAARDALARSGVDPARVGLLIHAAVCRDMLEPATASFVHHALGLFPECLVHDLSNACLGVVNGIVDAANRIELGQLDAALIVAGEDGGPLVEETLRWLVEREDLSKSELKHAFASLTIGAGAAAVVLERAAPGDRSQRLVGGFGLAATEHSELCLGDRASDAGPLMQTDSEALLIAGNALATRTFERFLGELEWTRDDVDRIVTHQVGSAHRRTLFESLALDPARDFPTVAELGNIGSVSLPLSAARAIEVGFVRPGHRLALLGIGSGLHSMMLGLEW